MSGDLWFTRQQAADLVGLSARQFDDAIRPLLPEKATRGGGRSLRFSGPAVVAAHVERRVEQAGPSSPSPPAIDGDDPLMNGDGSPALESYRWWRAEEVKLKVERERGTHVQVSRIRDSLLTAAVAVRNRFDRLVRRYDNELAVELGEIIDEYTNTAVRVIDGNADVGDEED